MISILLYIVGRSIGACVLNNSKECPGGGKGFKCFYVGRNDSPWSHACDDLDVISCHGDDYQASSRSVC